MGIIILLARRILGTPPPGPDHYLRPDGVSLYNRPDGISLYLRP